ncbi:hypothetical protein C6988_03255 [Nitrosopumilus sp. b1]|uniref:hypothetical protein n=1 Tax=Nitrosopumilus sp. b1 TaxID=2109907 RepID=UPI0015F6027F|nr:hypothetical protein [Nitrosopumilus sp. b1]KAF6243466.1 hypothetical protein C6988_03255 [Nitrosopumilus sp. b1]
METHRKFSFIGLFLLIATFGINYYHEQNHPGDGFNYAYVTGIAMIIFFMISFAMFNMDRWKKSKKS